MLLERGRQLAFQSPGTSIDSSSVPIPALALYTGTLYTPEFKEHIWGALKEGTHCLIISGGFGFLRPEEATPRYEAPIQRTERIWKPRLPKILFDYIARNAVTRVFVACPKQYAAAVLGAIWTSSVERVVWFVPSIGPRQGAMRKVPTLIREAVSSLVANGMVPDYRWRP